MVPNHPGLRHGRQQFPVQCLCFGGGEPTSLPTAVGEGNREPQQPFQRPARGHAARRPRPLGLAQHRCRWTDFHVQHLASTDGQPSQDSQGEPLGGEGHKFCSGRARVWWPVVPAFRPQFPTAALRGPSCSFGERRLAVWGARAQQFQRPVRWGSGWETHS